MVDIKKNIARKVADAPSHEKSGRQGNARGSHSNKRVKGLYRPEPKVFYFLGGILVLTILAYSNSLYNQFLPWDDALYITNNPDIKGFSPGNLKALFSNFYVGNWQPLTMLTYAFEFSIAGIKSPFLYHFDNLLLHLVNVVLVFWLMTRFVKNHKIALLAALLFAIHPMRVESVTWIAERKDVLYSVFFLCALIVYISYLKYSGIAPVGDNTGTVDKKRAGKFYAIMLLLFVLSALSKSAAVVFPLVMLLVDYLFKRKIDFKVLTEKIPFFVIALIFGFLAIRSQQGAIKTDLDFSVFDRLFLVSHSVIRYLFLSIIPFNLAALHPYPVKINGSLPLMYYLSPIFLIFIIALVVYSARYTRMIVFGALFFVVTMILTLPYQTLGGAVISERYTYMPHVGLFFVIAFYGIYYWDKKFASSKVLRPVLGIILISFTAYYAIASYGRNKVWEGPISLWTDVIEKYPDVAYMAYYDRGGARQGVHDKKGALEDYNKSISIKPNYDKALINRGYLKQETGDLQGALADYNKAAEVTPGYAGIYVNRADLKKVMHDLAGAVSDYDAALRLTPNNYLALINRGSVKQDMGNLDGAMEDFKQVIKIKPDYNVSYNNLGTIMKMKGDLAGALQYYDKSVQLNPQQIESMYSRGTTKFALKDYQGAILDFTSVIQIKDNYLLSYFYRGASRFNLGDKAAACQDWKQGAALGSKECENNLKSYCN